MTEITYIGDEIDFTLEVRGHAGYAEYGNDIVCSAISVLTQTLIAYMDEVAEDMEARINPGDVYLWAMGRKAIKSAEVILKGYEMLADSFPDYVTFDKGCPNKTNMRLR